MPKTSFTLRDKSTSSKKLHVSPVKRTTIKAGIALFFVLACWSLSNPPGSTPDEWFQLGSIWCAQGIDSGNCTKIEDAGIIDQYRMGNVNLDYSSCLIPIKSEISKCAQSGFDYQPINSGAYPSGVYKILNFFVPIGTSLSVLVMRLFSALLAVVFFVAQVLLMDNKRKIAWLTAFSFTLIPMAIFLLSSLHPSGWAITGVTHGWMFLNIALTNRKITSRRRAVPLLLWVLCGFICLVSRYDAFLFFVASSFVSLVVCSQISRLIQPRRIAQASIVAATASVLLFKLSPLVRSVLSFPNKHLPGQAGTSQWISHWLLNTIAVPVETLGTGLIGTFVTNNPLFVLRTGKVSQPEIPNIVWIIGIALLGGVFLFSLINVSKIQIATLSGLFLLLTWVILGVSSRLERDLFNVPGRYIIPLVPFIVGITVYLSRSPIQLMEIRSLRTLSIGLLSFIHFIALHSVVETYTDKQSFALLPIHVSESGWWWIGLPFGPNFVVIVGSICFVKFLFLAWSTVPTNITINELSRKI